MDKREKLMEVALLTLGMCIVAATDNVADAAPKKGAKTVECFGINTCKGTNGCSITPDQMEAASKKFNKTYKKSKPFDCAGFSDCSAKNDFLAWVSKPNDAACFSANGFVFDKDAGGNVVIRDKSSKKG